MELIVSVINLLLGSAVQSHLDAVHLDVDLATRRGFKFLVVLVSLASRLEWAQMKPLGVLWYRLFTHAPAKFRKQDIRLEYTTATCLCRCLCSPITPLFYLDRFQRCVVRVLTLIGDLFFSLVATPDSWYLL